MSWRINGGHKQATREGYNLLNNTLQSQTKNGLKVTVNEDKSVKAAGTTTEATALIFDQSIRILSAGTYILTDCSTFIESEENYGGWNSGETKTFTTDATVSGSGFYKYYAPNEVVNETLYPMLVSGSELKPYEQYGEMPSRDCPSEIETVKNSVKIDILNNDNTKSQTAIMPLQQEMLEGDYIADVEHHEWSKLILTGDESWNYTQIETKSIHYLQIETKANKIEGLICNQYKYAGKEHSWQKMENNQIEEENGNNFIFIRNDSITSQADFKTYLKQQYEAGTAVTIYYKLATPVDLELTEEQKSVRKQKLYTYKNITNVSIGNELANIDVEYKKDQNTINKNFENRLTALETTAK